MLLKSFKINEQVLIRFFLILKSMKFFAMASAIIFIGVKSMPIDCGEGRISNKLHFCIKPEFIEGCSLYDTETICSECDQGYRVNKNGGCDALQFQERQQKIQGCLRRNFQDHTKCNNCADGYIRRDGRCQDGIKNCQTYEQTNECKKCRPNYTLVLGQCQLNTILGCQKMLSSHTCQQCEPPFQLEGENCNIKNCKSLNDYGCVTCECGYYLAQDRTCKKFQNGCLRYERGRCIDCLNHYRLKGGICQIEGCISYQEHHCISCKNQYENQKGSCNFKNCMDWSNGQCLSCKQGFKNQGGVCRQEKSVNCSQ